MSNVVNKKTGHKSLRTSDYACQYMTHDSLVHRLGAGWKIAICTLLSALAVGIRTPRELLALVAVTLIYYFTARLTYSVTYVPDPRRTN